jgi:hypothetical protein
METDKIDRTVRSGSLGPQSGPVPGMVGLDRTGVMFIHNSKASVLTFCMILGVTTLLPKHYSYANIAQENYHFRELRLGFKEVM